MMVMMMSLSSESSKTSANCCVAERSSSTGTKFLLYKLAAKLTLTSLIKTIFIFLTITASHAFLQMSFLTLLFL